MRTLFIILKLNQGMYVKKINFLRVLCVNIMMITVKTLQSIITSGINRFVEFQKVKHIHYERQKDIFFTDVKQPKNLAVR